MTYWLMVSSESGT